MLALPGCERIGRASVRLGDPAGALRYAGQLEFALEPAWRGRGLGLRTLGLLLKLARRLALAEVWATTSPGNAAAQRTLERLGARLHDRLALPEHAGGGERLRYRIALR